MTTQHVAGPVFRKARLPLLFASLYSGIAAATGNWSQAPIGAVVFCALYYSVAAGSVFNMPGDEDYTRLQRFCITILGHSVLRIAGVVCVLTLFLALFDASA
ncbi:hypothetical protein ACOJIV_00310 [Haloarcula sp. AONF1]